MYRFVGVDLSWSGRASGVASIASTPSGLRLRELERLNGLDAVVSWIERQAADADAVVAVDAPLVIRNATGQRPAERALTRTFAGAHAGCYPSNLGRPFATVTNGFRRRLEQAGYAHRPDVAAGSAGRFQIEVYPHAAAVRLFGLDRIVKYKKGPRARRGVELGRLRRLLLEQLPRLDPPLTLELPAVPERGDLKAVEDQIDAAFCAYLAAHWWRWGKERNELFGTPEDGCIVVPRGPASAARSRAVVSRP